MTGSKGMAHSKDDALTAGIRAAALARIETFRERARNRIERGTSLEMHVFDDGHESAVTKFTPEARIAQGTLKYLDEIYSDIEKMELMSP